MSKKSLMEELMSFSDNNKCFSIRTRWENDKGEILEEISILESGGFYLNQKFVNGLPDGKLKGKRSEDTVYTNFENLEEFKKWLVQ